MWEIKNLKKNYNFQQLIALHGKIFTLKSFFAHDSAFNLSYDIEMSCLQGQTITSSENSSLPLYGW